ncbi:MAG: tRNA pseudouridine(38-40) synthase TruA [Candidatus Cloacimonadia bacterium]
MNYKKFLLRFAYDGTDFYGWQIQKDRITIQGVMEDALTKIFKSKTELVVSGRTDARVHAYNQYAHFSAETRMRPQNIIPALNSLLPSSIFVKDCIEIPFEFHARFSAKSRTYLYKINKQFSPFDRNFTAFFPGKKINSKTIRSAIPYLIGSHDFEVFANDTSQLRHCFCTVISTEWEEDDSQYRLYITANRFLHNMVRRIVGTLLKISHYNLENDYIKKILEQKDYTLLGATAPPQGLYLYEVAYEFPSETEV